MVTIKKSESSKKVKIIYNRLDILIVKMLVNEIIGNTKISTKNN